MKKIPRQQRSREMVERLIDGTATCLVEHGLDNTTTNHIADAAGVSIGSLYQYFNDKDELVEALLERLSRTIRQNFRARASALDVNQLPLRDMASQAIALGFNTIKTDPLIRELVRNWNRVPVNLLLDPLSQFFLTMAQPYFLSNYRDYPIRNLESKLYVLITSTLFTAIHYLNQDDILITEKDLIDTLTDMIVNLLEQPG